MKEIKLDKNKSTIKQDISMCSNNEIVNTNFNNCSTRDTILNQKIENETERAINKETELEEKIKESGKIDDVLVNGESVVEDKIAKIDLTSYATKTDIEEEKTERQDEDTSIRARVKQEILDRKTADSSLQKIIQNEATFRRTADTSLGNRITTLNKDLTSEISNRESADNTLQANIDTLIVDGGELVYEQ